MAFINLLTIFGEGKKATASMYKELTATWEKISRRVVSTVLDIVHHHFSWCPRRQIV